MDSIFIYIFKNVRFTKIYSFQKKKGLQKVIILKCKKTEIIIKIIKYKIRNNIKNHKI